MAKPRSKRKQLSAMAKDIDEIRSNLKSLTKLYGALAEALVKSPKPKAAKKNARAPAKKSAPVNRLRKRQEPRERLALIKNSASAEHTSPPDAETASTPRIGAGSSRPR